MKIAKIVSVLMVKWCKAGLAFGLQHLGAKGGGVGSVMGGCKSCPCSPPAAFAKANPPQIAPCVSSHRVGKGIRGGGKRRKTLKQWSEPVAVNKDSNTSKYVYLPCSSHIDEMPWNIHIVTVSI